MGVKERTETSGRLPKLSSGTPPVCFEAMLQRCRQTERLSGVLLIKGVEVRGGTRCKGETMI